MKKLLLATIAFSGVMACSAQDTTVAVVPDTTTIESADTIHVGGMIIIKKKGTDGGHDETVVISNNEKRKKPSNISTNWCIFDFGFANWDDKTNYSSQAAMDFAPGFDKDKLQLRSGKSVNVNFWFFMQRVSLIKRVVNLKYGLGLELNNYHFDDEKIKLTEDPTQIVHNPEFESARKNKLAADYITVPMMLNFNFTPDRKNGFGLSAGVSAGYLYSARQKVKIGDERDKWHDDFNLRDWKISYVAELNLGPINLYGSYATQSMWEKGLDQTPYNVGIRFSHW